MSATRNRCTLARHSKTYCCWSVTALVPDRYQAVKLLILTEIVHKHITFNTTVALRPIAGVGARDVPRDRPVRTPEPRGFPIHGTYCGKERG